MESRLYWQIHQLCYILEKQLDDELKEQLGIGFAQYKVLEAVNQNLLASQVTIAQLLDQTEAGISRQVKILQPKGLIIVGDVLGNKRARELSLSEIGEEIVRQAENILEVAYGQVFGLLGYQEQRLMQEQFERMLNKAKKLNQ